MTSLLSYLDHNSVQLLVKLISFTWQSSLVLIGALVLSFILRKNDPSIRHLILTCAVILLPVIPVLTYLIESNQKLNHEFPIAEEVLTFYPNEESILFNPVVIESDENLDKEGISSFSQINVPKIIVLSISFLSSLLLIKILIEKLIIDWKLRPARKIDRKYLLLFSAAADHIELKRGFSVHTLSGINSPFTYGFFRHRVFIPEDLIESVTQEELKAIALHELNHIHRNDTGTNFILAILKSLLFFNPVLWVTIPRILALAEQACDETAIRYSINELEYAKLLTKLAKIVSDSPSRTMLLAGFQKEDSNFYKRIKNILNKRRKDMREIPGGLKILAVTLILTLVYASTLIPIKVNARVTDSDSTEEVSISNKPEGLVFAYEDGENSLIFLEDNNEMATLLDNMDHGYVLNSETYNKVGSEFGHRKHPYSGEIKFHNGIDIVAKEGDEILAFADGTVLKSSEKGDHGNVVIIRHEQELVSWYSHLKDIDVVNGQRVKKGQKIGTVGSTGLSTGSHLHFSLKCNKYYIDPHSLEVFKKELDMH